MSADNAVFIFQIPIKEGFEYKVLDSFVSTIDSMYERTLPLEIRDAYTVSTLKKAKTFQTEQEAYQYAKELYAELFICEYGICPIELDYPLPEVSVEEANRILDDYWG